MNFFLIFFFFNFFFKFYLFKELPFPPFAWLAVEESLQQRRKAEIERTGAVGAFGRRLRRRGHGHRRSAVSAGQSAEGPGPDVERLAHVLVQLVEDGIQRVLQARVDSLRQRVNSVKNFFVKEFRRKLNEMRSAQTRNFHNFTIWKFRNFSFKAGHICFHWKRQIFRAEINLKI